jgi:hypothetical protein
MFYIDTPTMHVDAFDFDGNSGSITNRRTVVTVKSAPTISLHFCLATCPYHCRRRQFRLVVGIVGIVSIVSIVSSASKGAPLGAFFTSIRLPRPLVTSVHSICFQLPSCDMCNYCLCEG